MSDVQGYPKITPFLWFDANAEEAVEFYLGIFPNSRILGGLQSEADASVPRRKALTVAFELDGQKFTALNGGPHFKFNESISFVVRCSDQTEIDDYWRKLTADGGVESRCGWLKDKFGLSWQVVPANLPALISSPRGMQAMMTMTRLDIAALERAAAE